MRIGVDVGGSHISIGAVNEENNIIVKHEKDIRIYESDNPRKLMLDCILTLIKEVLEKLNISEIEKIGIACPGTIRDGKIIRAENLGISEKSIPEYMTITNELAKKFNTDVFIRNDAKCAGLAEKTIGSLKEYSDSVFLTLGTGIGGAVFFNNKLLVPNKNNGFEIGHMVIDTNGEMCTCGRRGCFETLASMKKLKEDIKYRLNISSEFTGIQLENLLNDENQYNLVEDIVMNYIHNLSIGIANLINIFEPEIVSIGGSFVHYKNLLVPKLENELKKKNAIFNEDSVPKIITAELGNEAGIIGAVL